MWISTSRSSNIKNFHVSLSALTYLELHFVPHLQFQHCSPYTPKLTPSSSPNMYQSWYLLSSPQQNPLFSAGLPIHLTPFLRLRFGFWWPLCTPVNYIYLQVTYLELERKREAARNRENLVSTDNSFLPVSLSTHAACDADGSNAPWLCDDDVTVATLCCVVVENILRHLRGLATARLSLNHSHLLALHHVHNL